MGLPWFELDVDFHEHPKAIALQVELGNATAEAYVSRVWAYCYHHAVDRFEGAAAAATVEQAAKAAARQQKRRSKVAAELARAPPVTRDVGRDVQRESHADRDRDKDKDESSSLRSEGSPPAAAPGGTGSDGAEREPSSSGSPGGEGRFHARRRALVHGMGARRPWEARSAHGRRGKAAQRDARECGARRPPGADGLSERWYDRLVSAARRVTGQALLVEVVVLSEAGAAA